MPVVRRSSAGSRSRRKARMPQWASLAPVRKNRFSTPVSTGLPTQRCSHGIAPGWMTPFRREPITTSAPVCSGSIRRGTSAKS